MYRGISVKWKHWNLHVPWNFMAFYGMESSYFINILKINQNNAIRIVEINWKWKANLFCRGVAIKLFHRRYSIILGMSRKIRTFSGLDTWRFNDVSRHRIFHAAEEVRFRKNTGPDTQCTRCVSGTRYPSTFPLFKRIRVRFNWHRDHGTSYFTQFWLPWLLPRQYSSFALLALPPLRHQAPLVNEFNCIFTSQAHFAERNFISIAYLLLYFCTKTTRKSIDIGLCHVCEQSPASRIETLFVFFSLSGSKRVYRSKRC